MRNFFSADSTRPHVTYSNRICSSTRNRIRSSIHESSVTIVNRVRAMRWASWRLSRQDRSVAMLNIYAVKTGSEFVTSSDLKVFGLDRPHDSKIFANSKLSILERGLQKLRIRMPDSPNTRGRKANPRRKSCAFKIPRYVWTGPKCLTGN